MRRSRLSPFSWRSQGSTIDDIVLGGDGFLYISSGVGSNGNVETDYGQVGAAGAASAVRGDSGAAMDAATGAVVDAEPSAARFPPPPPLQYGGDVCTPATNTAGVGGSFRAQLPNTYDGKVRGGRHPAAKGASNAVTAAVSDALERRPLNVGPLAFTV
jgi:hypothetical protein